jgi:4-hydroxy-tetrahydrodipicolinate reductase
MSTLITAAANAGAGFKCVHATNRDLTFFTQAEHRDTIDVVIDFSHPTMTHALIHPMWTFQKPWLIGTTGLSDDTLTLIQSCAQHMPIMNVSNTSLGAHVLAELAQRAALTLGTPFDIEIIETHHHHKTDAPSGTALHLARALQEIRSELTPCFGRHGAIGPRVAHEIGIHAVRGGSITGEHRVIFFGPDESIEITHRTTSRTVFADGALRLAHWLVHQKNGFYTQLNV